MNLLPYSRTKPRMSLTSFKCQQSFLSPEVKDLLQKALHANSNSELALSAHSWVTHDCGIIWEKLEELFTGIKEKCESKAWFFEAVTKIAPLFTHCQSVLRNLSQDDYSVTIHPMLCWTHQESEVSACLKLISAGSCESDHLVALLTITAVTERALGNLVLTRREQVPFLLRDLLVTPELHEILGKTRIQLLIILLGSVVGLNLRNIAWHGFLSPCEANPAFVATIITVLVDCGRFLKECYRTADIPCRQLASFKEACVLGSVFKDVSFPPRLVMEELILKSPLVPTVMVPVWMKALDLIGSESWGMSAMILLPMMECSLRCLFAHVNGVSERVLTAENSSFYTTLDEILKPNINEEICDSLDLARDNQRVDEHCQNTSYEHNETQPQATTVVARTSDANQVLIYIGKKLNEALHDLLNFVQGPRVRDRVSHGEVKLEYIPQSISQHILYLCLLILSLGNWRCLSKVMCVCYQDESCIYCNAKSVYYLDTGEDKTCCDQKQSYFDGLAVNDATKRCICEIKFDFITVTETSEDFNHLVAVLSRCIEKYKSIYHPSAILHEKLTSCTTLLDDWTTWKRVDCSELDYNDWENREKLELPKIIFFFPLKIAHKVVNLDDIQEFLTLILNINFEVLYRSKMELEFVSLLHRIIANVQSSLENICENLSVKYLLYVNKKLRSRQRETYRRQLNAIPVVIINCYLTVQAVYLLFFSINRVSQLSKSCSSDLLRVLKVVLKAHENIVSQTSLNANRWEEAVSVSLKNITTIKENFSENFSC
ncbi:endoplasmic reticulum membrane-associated RNA degradation protein-like isoform X2 [Panulirus ornatus]|uniref:endoplasmic reticulum membrane-associated RNA degradation protein-like isoform X2 n=1 Tax=Panulirus ornatus TaxID=150431 RepID=UPI003A894A0E